MKPGVSCDPQLEAAACVSRAQQSLSGGKDAARKVRMGVDNARAQCYRRVASI